MNKRMSWIRLSHTLSFDTPAYGGGEGLKIEKVRSLDKGDSCNASYLAFSSHLGTHVDAPSHFIKNGKTISQYQPDDWVFNYPHVIDVVGNSGDILGIDQFDSVLSGEVKADILLVRTGFEKFRGQKCYWDSSPAFAPELATYFKERFPTINAIGIDTISISSMLHREMGRKTHRSFLGKGFRIFEDVSLMSVSSKVKLSSVIASPLIIENIEGTPCTILASLR